jgi:hypothetical protein
MKPIMLIISSLVALILGVSIWIAVSLNRPVSAREMSEVRSEMAGMSSAETLEAFAQGGIPEGLLAKVMGCSRFTIRRIRSGESQPTPSMDATIQGLYSNYLLLKKSNLLFRCRFLSGYDQFYCFPDPLREAAEI